MREGQEERAMTKNIEKRDFTAELMLDGTHSTACFEYLRASLFALASASEWTRCCTKDDTMPCPNE